MIKGDATSLLPAIAGTDFQFPKVTFDGVEANMTDWVAANYDGTNYTQGNIVILDIPTETYIHNG